MEIVINTKAGTVSVDKVSRAVVFPPEYSKLDTLKYDTVSAEGISSKIGDFIMSSIIATALGLWHGAEPTVATVWELIKAKRDDSDEGGVFVAGNWFHTDAMTVVRYSIMLGMASTNKLPNTYIFNYHWKTMSGAFTPMTVSLLKRIIAVGMTNVGLNFQNAEQHKIALLACTTPAKYDYSTGWVVIYG